MSEAEVTVEIVLFEVAGNRYGADMTQVRRIGRADETDSVGSPFGVPAVGRRALIFTPPGGHEICLPIDAVLGVETVRRDDLRRLPLAVGPTPFVLGAWLNRDQAVLLVDLHATNPFRPAESHHA
jgi:chemotaxis signal transduction protein